MDWKTLILEIRARELTLQEIADETGMSKGQVHDLMTGRGKSVLYSTGVRLVDLHKRMMRRKPRAAQSKAA